MHLSHGSQDWIFLCFAFAFLVKMPLVPFHGWLADGYKSMPIPAVAVFTGVVSKVAAYGFLRIVLPLFPYASVHYQMPMLVLCLISIMWGTAGRVHDHRRADGRRLLERRPAQLHHARDLLAEAGRGPGRAAADGQPRLVTAPMFFIVAALAARAGGSEDLRDMGGIAFRAPVLAVLALIVALATLAMPGSSNFIGEFMILLGVFQAKLAVSVIAFARCRRRRRLCAAAVHHRAPQPRQVRRSPRARSDSARRSAIMPLVVVILALALLSAVRAQALAADAPDHDRAGAAPGLRAGQGGEPMTLLLAAAHIKGPHIDWKAFSPLLALAVGGFVVLLVGLFRPRGDPREDRARC